MRFGQSLERVLSTTGLGLLLATAGCAGAPRQAAVATASKAVPPPEPTAAERYRRAEARRLSSDYAGAEADFRAVLDGPFGPKAKLGLAQVLLITGRPEEALPLARAARQADPSQAERAACVAADALRRAGNLSEARAELAAFEKVADARAAHLALGELELELGHRGQAAPLLMTLIEDYNEERISEADGEGLTLAARAAWLLRSPKDANTLFNAAERAKMSDAKLLLWRAQLFLEKYDPAHAEEVLKEVLKAAPNQPEALTLLAQVRLDQALDFDEAESIARRALSVDSGMPEAHFVLAGIALRDMELAQADREIDAGLAHAPRNLPLLSLRAVVRFLADDQPGFQREKRAVLELNPEYTRLYAILGEYADWEHRYDEIVALMREALAIDKEDASALAQLGLNLIRAGDDVEGVSELSRAFALDPYNVRVYNTLGLYDTLIPKHYVSVRTPRFVIRYHKDDRAILERYVPELLNKAFDSMQVGYGFSPSLPIGVELYAERESFSVRTSGLPQTAIQGVCFGRTLAAMSPQHESFNLGMTLWHELSHVFHIQLSRNRVPRWFTEGLAEYETLVTRPEWSRQHDPELYELLRADKLPSVARMSRAFTRAEALSDIATAYYASTKIVEMLAQQHGREKIALMLRAWGSGKRSEEVFQGSLGVGTDAVDRAFRELEKQKMARYDRQFVPISRARSLEVLLPKLREQPKDPNFWVELSLASSRAGKQEAADESLSRALALDPKNVQARFLSARVAADKEHPDDATKQLRALLKEGGDGYAVNLALADLARARGDTASARAAYELATRWDPTQAEPLMRLADIAAAENVPDDELSKLELLAPLSAHSPGVQKRFLRRLLEKKRFDDAVKQGEAALWADVNGLETHVLFADALLGQGARGSLERAHYELESALLCPGEPPALSDVHARLAELLTKLNKPADAHRHALEAKRLDPKNARLQGLKL